MALIQPVRPPLALTPKGIEKFGSEGEVLRALQNAKPITGGRHGTISHFTFQGQLFILKDYKANVPNPETGDEQAALYARIEQSLADGNFSKITTNAGFEIILRTPVIFAHSVQQLVMERISVLYPAMPSELDGGRNNVLRDLILALPFVPAELGSLFIHSFEMGKSAEFVLLDPRKDFVC